MNASLENGPRSRPAPRCASLAFVTLRRRCVPGLAALLVACVPAAEELDPRGAAGVIVEPSLATRGEPFSTSDGFTVKIETFAFMAAPRARADDGDMIHGTTAPRVWGATQADMFIPAMPVGPYNVDLQLEGTYMLVTEESGFIAPPKVSELDTTPGVARSVLQRFLEAADNHGSESEGGRTTRISDGRSNYSVAEGPTVVFVLRADKAGRSYRLDLALATKEGYVDPNESGTKVDVHANDVSFARWETHAERLLLGSAGNLVFADIAGADEDGDGRVTPAELRAVSADDRVCEEGDEVSFTLEGDSVEPACPTLLDRLATRARSILVKR